MNSYVKVLKQFANFKGKSSRQEFLKFFLVHVLFIALLAVILFWLFYFIFDATFALVFYCLSIGYFSFILFPTLALIVRRLHDAGKSGLWIYFPLSVSILFSILTRFIAELSRWTDALDMINIIFGIILAVFLLKERVNPVTEIIDESNYRPKKHNKLIIRLLTIAVWILLLFNSRNFFFNISFLSEEGFFIPHESSLFSFQSTEWNTGSGEWWNYGEDSKYYYGLYDPYYMTYYKLRKGNEPPGFDKSDYETWGYMREFVDN